MKKILIGLFLIPLLSSAQQEGTINYEETITLNFDMSKMPEHVQERMKEHKVRKHLKELHYSKKASIYQNKKVSEETAPTPGRGMRFMMMRPEERIYVNLEEKRTVEERDFMDKKFLIKDQPEVLKWKISGEQKEILGYRCMKATAQVDTLTRTAWFTLQIPLSIGPDGFGGLPGAILELDYGDNMRVVEAIEIVANEVDADLLLEPKKGKKVTREQFHEIQKEKMEEMRAEHGGGRPGHGGGGNRMIIMHH